MMIEAVLARNRNLCFKQKKKLLKKMSNLTAVKNQSIVNAIK